MANETISSTALLSPVWTHLTNIQPVKGEGVYLYDSEGKRYTDFTSGIGVINTGHCHPRVVKAIQEQAKTLFEGKRGPEPVAAHREPELLYSEIGKLKVELDWLKKKSGMSLS